ncbi:MAG TPA: alpha/beta fold hydrolase [Candidatus Acidoferrales bacterium]|nr:alpha/beta fold hydrolase [Candidatus Acidoferrales bacterium]
MNQPSIRLGFCLLILFILAGCKTNEPSKAVPSSSKITFVLVHGAWGGGWDWKHVDDLLTADGYDVYRPTLSGLGEHSNISNTNIDLDTHIQDIVNVILWENLHNVVLVGHSYGGMVITGVADRVPDRIKDVVYVDALLPRNGENFNAIIAKRILKPIKDGYVTDPWVTGDPPPPHDVLMPEKCFSEPITLTNQDVAMKVPSTYILTVDPGNQPDQDDFYPFYVRAKSYGWPAWIMEGDHNVQRSHPTELVQLLEKASRN